MWPSYEELLERFKVACDLKQPIDRPRILDAVRQWNAAISKQILPVRFVKDAADAGKTGRAARAARAARDARDAMDAMDARAARDARDAMDARDAWAARAARDAMDAWDARDAMDAWDARAARDARDAWDASWDLSWMSVTALGARSKNDQSTFDKWFPLLLALEAGAFALWITDTEIVVAERPAIVAIDDQRRLHAEHGPAFDFLGVKDFYWRGNHVPELVVMTPEKITLGMIESEKNAEVRRVMIERYGTVRYAQDIGLERVHQDGHGILWRRAMKDDAPIILAEVFNPTPEPDGVFTKAEILAKFARDDKGRDVALHRSMAYVHDLPEESKFKTYFLKIHPECRPMRRNKEVSGGVELLEPQPLTCHAAVASTYGRYAADYDPEMRT